CSAFGRASPTCLATLSLPDALPIWPCSRPCNTSARVASASAASSTDSQPLRHASSNSSRSSSTTFQRERAHWPSPLGASVEDLRSEEHTSELQSRVDLVCRLLLEKQ